MVRKQADAASEPRLRATARTPQKTERRRHHHEQVRICRRRRSGGSLTSSRTSTSRTGNHTPPPRDASGERMMPSPLLLRITVSTQENIMKQRSSTSRRGWRQPRSVERSPSHPSPAPLPIRSCPMAPIPMSHRRGTTYRTTTEPTPRTASSTCRSDTPHAQGPAGEQAVAGRPGGPVGDGAERNFCAGAELRLFQSAAAWRGPRPRLHRMLLRVFDRLPIPIVAAVHETKAGDAPFQSVTLHNHERKTP